MTAKHIKIKYKGVIYSSLKAAAIKLGIPVYNVHNRLRRGESIENVFSKKKLSNRAREINFKGKKYRSLEEVRKKLNPKEDPGTVSHRFRRGWSIEEALGLKKHVNKAHKKIKFRDKIYENHSELARAFNININTFLGRMSGSRKYKFTIAEALGLKDIKRKGFTKNMVVNGKKFYGLKVATRHYKISYNVIRERLKKGWTPDQAFEFKKRRDHHPGKSGIIYLIKNKINGKIYIGASLGTLYNRWKWHIQKSNRKVRIGSLQEAILNFGSKNFSKKVIKRCKFFPELGILERFYINKYNSRKPNGYNLASGGIGFGNLGKKITVNNIKFKTLKDAAKYFKINTGTFVTRLNSGRTPEEAAGIKKYDKPHAGHKQINIDGKKFSSLKAAVIYYKTSYSMVINRLSKNWTIKKALVTPKIETGFKITIKGKKFTSIREAAKFFKVHHDTARQKLARGISIDDAFIK